MKRKKVKKFFTLLACVSIFVYALVNYIADQRRYTGELDEIKYSYHFIDVGQGDCTLIMSDTAVVLIDSGSGMAEYTTVEYIKSLVDRIDLMILTHPHEDHIGNADEIIEKIGVNEVVMPNISSESMAFDNLLSALEKHNCKVTEGKFGEKLTVGDIEIEMFSPVSEYYEEGNNYSIVSKVTTGEISALITGDAEALVEKEILDRVKVNELKCDILKAGHHGSSTSTSDEFLYAVSPRYCVISCGKANQYGHPHYETVNKLEENNIEYFRLDKTGTVVFNSDGKKLTVSGFYT